MKQSKLTLSLLLAFALVVTSLSFSTNVYAAKKPKLNKTRITLTVGKTYKLKVKNNKKKVTWKSSNKKVATVTSSGKVNAKKAGKAKITAKVKKKKMVCTVIVNKKTTANNRKPAPTTNSQKPPQITSENSLDFTFLDDLDTCGPFRDTNVEYELSKIRVQWKYDPVFNNNHVKLFFSGRKTYDSFGNTHNSSIVIRYKIYNENDAVVASGFAMTPQICVGDKFEDVETTVSVMFPNGNYKIKVENS